MSTTLTNGLKLPDKGSVDWYADMQSNYAILDGAVGTVAEHTSQIAGKAPAVHTHTKSDITDFPVYGTTAGTICEGNDSRLSDARTPVTHTHVTADVTDLLNSAHTWSGNNTYTATINYQSSYTLGNLPQSPTAQQAFKILESTGTDFTCDIDSFQNTLATGLRFTTKNKMDANGFSPSGTIKAAYLYFLQNAENKGYLQWDGYTKNSIIPLVNNSYNLGSSSYQWNYVYANTVNAANAVYTNTVWASSVRARGTSNALVLAAMETWEDGGRIFMYGKDNVNGSTIYADIDHNDGIHSKTGVSLDVKGFYPSGVSRHLGLSNANKKWLTFNGINPGALSLPNVNAVTGSSNTQLQDISGDLVQDQYFNCYFTPRMDGWAYIALNCSNATIRSGHSSYTVSVKTARGFADSIYTQSFTKNENAFSNVQIFIPVTANKEVTLECSFTGFSVTKGYVIPCLGNV